MKSVIVDATELQGSINSLQSFVNTFGDIELSLFSKVMYLRNIWNDGYTTSFYESIENEKHQIDVLIQDLKNFTNVYNYIFKVINKYGKKIKVDFSNLSDFSSTYNSCNQKFSTIESMYNNLDLSNCPAVADSIQDQKAKFIATQRILSQYNEDFYNTINDIKNMEYEVGIRTNNLEINIVESINFNNLPTYDPETNIIGMSSTEDIETALNNINASIQEEIDNISDINNIFVTMRNHYISDSNNKKLSDKQIDFNCQFKTIKSNHENMIIYINKLKDSYLKLSNETKEKIDTDIKKVS